MDQFFELLPEFMKVKPIWIGKIFLTEANTAFYKAKVSVLHKDAEGYISMAEKTPDKMYLVEFSENAGWYNYQINGNELLHLDWGFGNREEVLQRIENRFGKEISIKEIADSQVQQAFEEIIKYS